MGVYVTLLNSLVSRLTTAQQTGGKLDSIKAIYAGPRALVEKIEDTPSIVVEVSSISENYGVSGSMTRLSSDIEVTLWVKYGNDDADATNLYFNTVAGTGVMYLVEKIGDALNETSGLAIDPRLGALSRSPIRLEFTNFETYGPTYIFELKLRMTTVNFLINGRSG